MTDQVGSTDQEVVLLACGHASTPGKRHRFPFYGSRRAPSVERVPASLAGLPVVALPTRPGREAVDPLLEQRAPRRLVLLGEDADLAAVLVRLLRTNRLDVELAYLPARRSAAARAWSLPVRRAAGAHEAIHGKARLTPLIRDDAGGVLVGRGEVRAVTGEAYCDNTLVLRGSAKRLVAVPGPEGVSSRPGHGVTGATGRALQIGCVGSAVVVDGVPHPRTVQRWTWYRHTEDWLLVRP